MARTQPRDEREQARITTFAALAAAEEECTRCPLYRDATQAVPGEGSRSARLMIVGEQPGDREDIEGRPFVGPAGRILDRGLKDAGIDRNTVFETNAVKHFKHETRGKRRLHKRPNAYEIDRCAWWLDIERRLVEPKLILAMGATAVRSVLGRATPISTIRGAVQTLEDGVHVVVTVHPSALLRVREERDKAAMYEGFVRDLAMCAELLARPERRPGASVPRRRA